MDTSKLHAASTPTSLELVEVTSRSVAASCRDMALSLFSKTPKLQILQASLVVTLLRSVLVDGFLLVIGGSGGSDLSRCLWLAHTLLWENIMLVTYDSKSNFANELDV